MEEATRLMKAGKTADAENLYWEVLQADPSDAAAGLNLASLLIDRHKVDEAATLLKNVRELEPDNPALHVLLSRVCYLRGQYDSSLEHVSKAHAALPENELIAREFAVASRSRYWNVSPAEYQELFDLASEGELDASLLPRLVHQLFSRMIRPQLLELLCGKPDGSTPTDDRDVSILDQFAEQIDDEDGKTALAILRRNFEQAYGAFEAEPAFGPRPALLLLANGSSVECSDWCDIDPFTRGSIEICDPVSQTRFISPVHLRRVILGPIREATDCTLETADGATVRGVMPAMSFFAQFCVDPEIIEGHKTVIRRLTDRIHLPLGLRAWWVNGKLVPMLNVREIVFE